MPGIRTIFYFVNRRIQKNEFFVIDNANGNILGIIIKRKGMFCIDNGQSYKSIEAAAKAIYDKTPKTITRKVEEAMIIKNQLTLL